MASKRCNRCIEKRANDVTLSLDEYLIEHISIYATAQRKNCGYTELIPELFAMSKGKNAEFAREVLREAGVIL